jgi:hypothetical protein
MSISPRAVLRGELHCLSHDGLEVRTAQHWVDPHAARPCGWLRLVVNGRPVQDNRFVGRAAQGELAAFWASRVALFEATALTEDRMWVVLAELAGIGKVTCSAGHRVRILPVAWPFCSACGRDVRAAPAGFGAVAAASKQVIVIDRRNIQDHG